ncbi:hypothetical protein [Amycolatopsis sp. PS_44_ISF1]|uniref:hypothetical protein n=1 Tax=Amycolatopsis sp. PS_44_ISF1 TaxID=2974917 RepID=UPI0028DDAA19|nr:hypothetical protein [Amycolatopsis sp. PS_44_ISF1]MDT8916048.1 hypothetical protein [Amycolatopsis sp. PS_44_ISF1]
MAPVAGVVAGMVMAVGSFHCMIWSLGRFLTKHQSQEFGALEALSDVPKIDRYRRISGFLKNLVDDIFKTVVRNSRVDREHCGNRETHTFFVRSQIVWHEQPRPDHGINFGQRFGFPSGIDGVYFGSAAGH